MATPCLQELPEDALRSIFAHVELPYVLKLTCRALRAAGPKRTGIGPRMIAKSVGSMRLAHVMRFPLCWNAQFAMHVAEAGNLQGFLWWKGATPLPDRPNRGHIPMNSIVLVAAARSGNLALLQWLVSIGFHDVHGKNMSDEIKDHSKAVAMVAAKHGHFHVLKWMHGLGCAMDHHTVNAAAEWGDYDMFTWLTLGGWTTAATEGIGYFPGVLAHAARGSGMRPQGEHRKILEHLLRRGNEWTGGTFRDAADKAALEMLQWMRRDGCPDPFPGLTTITAAKHNRRDVLEWLLRDHGHDYRLDAEVAQAAAQGGHLELLQWLRSRGCPWDFRAVQFAAYPKNLHVLRWMAANGAPIYHHKVNLHGLRRQLLATSAGPLVDELVPSAMWVHTLIRWRKVKLAVLRWGIARYWARLAAR